MKFAIASIALVFCTVSCRKDLPVDTYTHGLVIERNTSTPVPYAHVRLMNPVPVEGSPGDFTLNDVFEVDADENGRFLLPKGLDASLIYGYTNPETHYFNPSSTSQNYQPGKNSVVVPLIPYSWLKVRIIDEAPLNPEVNTVWISLDFRNELGLWEDIDEPEDSVFGRTFGGQKFNIFYRLYTEPGVYELHWMETPFIPPHDTLEVIIPY